MGYTQYHMTLKGTHTHLSDWLKHQMLRCGLGPQCWWLCHWQGDCGKHVAKVNILFVNHISTQAS